MSVPYPDTQPDPAPDLLGALRESFDRAALRRKDLAAEIARLGAELSADALGGDDGELSVFEPVLFPEET